MTKKFVDLTENKNSITYRITFEVNPADYQAIFDEIIAYGNILKEEVEIEVGSVDTALAMLKKG